MAAPRGILETTQGTISIDFFPEDAPGHVENFRKLAGEGFYDGLIFHRVVKGFVIQGGCPHGQGTGGPGYHLKAEFNERPHRLGTVAMARSADPDSAGSQFYICLRDLPQLDGDYTVFGQVVEGIDVVKVIGQVETDARDRPREPVVMERVRIVEAAP
ncbi:MAG: peptidylprolyl isomerase [Planctomycetes bacterium]|nr:peptidylprolyl isomerase [Planctomycetota bacterium]